MSTLFCEQCGETMPASARFCGLCGARQELADERPVTRVVTLGRRPTPLDLAPVPSEPPGDLPRARRDVPSEPPGELRRARLDVPSEPPAELRRARLDVPYVPYAPLAPLDLPPSPPPLAPRQPRSVPPRRPRSVAPPSPRYDRRTTIADSGAGLSEPTGRERHDPPRRPRPVAADGVHDAPTVASSARPTPAGNGARIGAALLDGLINLLLTAVGLGLFFAVAMVSPIGAFILLVPLVFVTPCVSMLLLARDGRYNGQTIGKHVAGIRVVALEGGPMTLAGAARRELLWKALVFSLVGGVLVLPSLLNLMWPLFDERHRALHDKGAGTLVVTA
jgi:uncharacterized RDD family membrane protein YckC